MEHRPLQPAYDRPQPRMDAGFANPNFKEMAKAVMRSQKILKEPDMGAKCGGKRYGNDSVDY